MSGILRLESLTKGNTLKQGDKTPLKYRLFDADGEKLNIAGKSAKVRLVYPDFLTIGYEKDGLTVAQDDTVTFTIDSVIPSRIYHVEIIVDDKFIFPSRADESKFTVDKSSLGTEANIIEIIGVDAVVRKAVDLINEDPNLIIDEDKLVNDIISNTGIGSIDEYYQQFSDVITELSEEKDYHSLPEIAGARGGFEKLNDRLNHFAETFSDGSPSIFYDTLAELKASHPQGAQGIALISETDPAKIYVWDGSVWKEFGDYQGIAIKDGAVKFNNLSSSLKQLVTDFTEKESSSVKGRVFIEQGIYQINSATAYLENKNLFRGYDVGYVQVGVGLQGGYSDRRRSQPIALSETERLTLTISGDINRHVWAFLDVDGNDMGVGVDEETVTAPVGAYWAQCYYYNGADNPPVGGNVQIEIGEASTTYTKNERITLKNDEPFEVGGNFSLVALYRSNLTKFVSKKIIGNKPEVYGVKYDPLQSNPKIERINDNDDSVDFDTVYPWSDIKVVNVKKTAWGATHITYKNESTFNLDGSNGDVMVEVPKHYVRRYREDGYEYVLISKHEQEGFEVDPSFIENGKVLDKIYVGRYMNIVENNVPLSKSGTRPTANTNVPQAVERSVAKGRGFNNFDFRTLQMLQRLFIVEYATRDSQSIFGGITKYVYHGKPECLALASGTGVNQITIKIGHESDKFRVGQSCAVSIGQEFQFRKITNIVSNPANGQRVITFSGDPVNITSGQTYIYSNPEASGQTDNLENLHGRLAGDSDKVSFSYRGIENLWGNLHELVAGVYTQYGAAFIADSMSDYGDMPSESYMPTVWQLPDIPYTGPQDATTPYIRTMGYDPHNPLIMLPNSAGTSTVGADHWTDEINAPHSDQVQYLAHGGGWDHYERSGLFNYRFFVDATNPDSGWLNGTRLIYKDI